MNKFLYTKTVDKKLSINAITIPVDIYKCEVQILMPKEAEVVGKAWGDNDGFGAVTNNFFSAANKILIRFSEYKEDYLVHELVHAAQLILHEIGHNHCKDEGDEPMAYLVGYLFKEAKIKIKEYNKKKKNKMKTTK